jgi:hypothetical protein
MGFRVPPGAVASLGGGAKQGSPNRIGDFNPHVSKKRKQKIKDKSAESTSGYVRATFNSSTDQ